jgi:hypothetical protein
MPLAGSDASGGRISEPNPLVKWTVILIYRLRQIPLYRLHNGLRDRKRLRSSHDCAP